MLAVSANAQDGTPLTNASYSGTYSFSFLSPDAEHTTKPILSGMEYFDGDGAARFVLIIDNYPGEPDSDGNPTRDNRLTVSDPSTWIILEDVYTVTYGGFATFGETSEMIPTRLEMIDGILTVTEFEFIGLSLNRFNRILIAYAHRLSDQDLLPPAPPAE